MADPRVVAALGGGDPRVVAPVDAPMLPEERDAASFRDNATAFSRGARQGFNQLGGMAESLAGTVGDALGLTDFAASRFAEAEKYTQAADSVAPDTRDYRQVKDFDSLVDFVFGQLGNAAANFAPALVGGVGGAVLKGGVRGAMVGLGAGSFVPNAGEQAQNIHAGPGTPGEKLANALGVGAVNAGLDMVPEVGVLKQIANPTAKGVAKQFLKTTALEGATEAAQAVVGHKGQDILDPNRDKSGDDADTINSGLAGMIGGAGLAGAGHVASVAPGLAADGMAALKGKLNHVPSPVDEDAELAKIAANPDLKGEDDFLAAIDGLDKDKDTKLGEILAHAGDRATEFKDWATNSETYDKAKAFAKDYVNEVKDKPAVQAAFAHAQGVMDGLKGEGEPKQSLQRTGVDLALHDVVMKMLPEGTKRNLSPTERIELSGMVKHAALHAAGARTEVEGPAEGQFPRVNSAEDTVGADIGGHESDRATRAAPLPASMLKLLGPDAAGIIEAAQGVLRSGGIPFKGDAKAAVGEAAGQSRVRKSRLDSIIQEHMKDEYLDDPEKRKLVTEGFTSLLNATDVHPETYRALADKAAESGAEGQRLSASGKRIMEAAGHVFKDRPTAMRAIEAHLSNEGFAREFHLSNDELSHFEEAHGEEQASDEEDTVDRGLGAEKRAPKTPDAYDDARLRAYDSVEEARQAYRELEADYSKKEVQIRHEQEMVYDDESGQMQPTGRIVLSAHDRASSDTMSGEPPTKANGYKGSGQWRSIVDRSPARQAGFEHGTLTVAMKDGQKVRVSLKALTAEAARTMERSGDSKKYPHDVVMHGLTMLLADKNVADIAGKTREETGPGAWDIPDDTVVGKVNGREYKWGEIKALSKMSPKQLRERQLVERPVEAAEQAESLQDIEDEMLPFAHKRLQRLKDNMDSAPGQPNGKFKGSAAYFAAKRRWDLQMEVVGKINDEIDRREKDGDFPKMAIGSMNVDKGMLEQSETGHATMRTQDRPGQRNVQEETGTPLHLPDTRPRGPGYEAHEVGLREEDRTGPTPAKPEAPKVDRRAEIERLLADKSWGDRKARDTLRRELKGMPEVKKSDARPNATTPVTEAQKAEIRDYVAKVLGDKNAKVLFKNLAHAGDFFEKDGVEVLRVANLAMDPMGVARHEAAHALFARLLKSDKAAAQQLLAAAGSAGTISRLRTLLRDHPDAIKQLSDPEERLAYMYQFWRQGEIDAGPKTEGILEKVRKFFQAVAGIWTGAFYEKQNADKAAAVFDLFERGGLSNRDTVAEALQDRFTKSAIARAVEVLRPATKVLTDLAYTSVGQVRSLNIPAFNAVMDKMWADPTKATAEPGFNQAKHPQRNIFLTRVGQATGASAAAQREALEAMQRGAAPSGAEAKAVVGKVRTLLADVLKYMQDKGVKAVVWNDKTKAYDELDIQAVRDYFPRYYDKEAIVAGRPAFVAMLKKNGFSATDADAMADNLVRAAPASVGENDEQVGLTYYAPNTLARKLNIPPEELAPFLRKDLVGTLNSYVNYAVRRAEYTARFGNQGQAIREAITQAVTHEGANEDQVHTFNRAVQALEGSLGHDLDPKLKKAMGWVQTYQNVRLLPLALFSSLTVDPIGVMVRGGTVADSFSAFARVVQGMVHERKDGAYDMALAVGSISDSLDAHMLSEAYGVDTLAGLQDKINSTLFKWNGMDSLNRSMRVAATSAAASFIVRHATEPGKHSARYLDELGLTPADVKVDKDGKLDVSSQKVKDAVNTWVDGAVLRPNAALRPTWMSDPHWMLVSHLKQYMYSFQKTILARVAHEIDHGNYTPAMAMLSYVPAIIASDLLRAALTPGGGDDEAWKRLTMAGALERGIQRAGITGPMGQYAMDSYGDLAHYRVPFASLGGPTFQQLVEMGGALASQQGSLGHELAQAVPGYILVR